MQTNITSAIAANATQAQSAADLLAQSLLYSVNVGGKAYPADISYASGQYTATVPDLPVPGVSANGSTLLGAESNLNARISVLV